MKEPGVAFGSAALILGYAVASAPVQSTIRNCACAAFAAASESIPPRSKYRTFWTRVASSLPLVFIWISFRVREAYPAPSLVHAPARLWPPAPAAGCCGTWRDVLPAAPTPQATCCDCRLTALSVVLCRPHSPAIRQEIHPAAGFFFPSFYSQDAQEQTLHDMNDISFR